MSFDRLLTKRATLLRPQTSGVDALNRPVVNFVAAGVLNCRIEQQRAVEVVTEAGETMVADWLIFLPADAEVTGRDRMTIDGVTYRLGPVDKPEGRGGRPHHTEVQARKVG